MNNLQFNNLKTVFLWGWFLFFLQITSAQQDNTKIENLDVALIAQVNQGNSYITFPTDIGNIEPLIFEGNLIPNFILRENKQSRLVGVLTPQIIIRMYNEYSYPVKTPSYIPQLTTYYLIGNRKKSKLLTAFGRLAHHSNGQDDDLILPDGSVNYRSGDFATNFMEGGAIITSFNRHTNAVRFFKLSYEYHPENSVHRLLKGRYSRHRLNFGFSAFRLPKNTELDKANFSLDVKMNLLLGDMGNIATFDADRIQSSITFSYFPHVFEDFGLFVEFYHGKDYYNVYYDETRNLIRFGIMTNKLRF